MRNDAPQELKDIFKAGGYLCDNADEFLIPFGNTPLGNDTSQHRSTAVSPTRPSRR